MAPPYTACPSRRAGPRWSGGARGRTRDAPDGRARSVCRRGAPPRRRPAVAGLLRITLRPSDLEAGVGLCRLDGWAPTLIARDAHGSTAGACSLTTHAPDTSARLPVTPRLPGLGAAQANRTRAP